MKARARSALTTLVLLAIAAGAIAVAWFGVHLRGEEEKAGEARSKKVLALDPAGVRALRVVSGGRAARLVREGDAWRVVEPVAADADADAVKRLLERLSGLERRATSAKAGALPSDLRPYGLDAPRTRIEVTLDDGKVETLALGEDTGFDGAMFVQPTSGEIAVVASDVRRDLDPRIEDLRDRRVLRFDEGAASRLEVRGAKAAYALARDAEGWRIASPLDERADEGAAGRVLSALHGLRADEIVDAPGPPASYGLDRPRLEVKVVGKDGAAHAASFGAERDGKVWARRGEGGPVFAVPASVLASVEVKAEDLRDRHVLHFDRASAAVLRIEGEGGPVEVRKEGEDAWKMVAPKEAKAEGWKVTNALWTLSGLEAAAIAGEGPKAAAAAGLDPPHRTFVVLDAGGKELGRLLLGNEKGDRVLAKPGGSPRVFEIEAWRVKGLPKGAADLEPAAPATPPQRG